MSGHSKWSTIKRKKAVTDAARGKLFTKCIKEITIAARSAGGDPGANPRLRTAILAAKAVNMPAANVERAIKKGTGELDGQAYEEVSYEGYAPAGVALLIESATDNRNRTTGELRHLLERYGGHFAAAGSVSYLFKARGLFVIEKSAIGEDALIELVLEAGADDVQTDGEAYEVLTSPAAYEGVREALAAKEVAVQSAEHTRLATLQVTLNQREAEQVLRLIDLVEEHDDVQKVYANFELPDEVLAKLAR
jgi:YebC/PmpR family DNA-binding regulatory protein